ncbi:MAG: sterol desaturase family protein [Sphingomonadales bacterium]|nr:sterol desaturase family protein [Sphingomonadales bacterium]
MADQALTFLFGSGTRKDRFFNLVPAAMIAAVLLFWSHGPAALLNSPWTLPLVSPLIMVTVLCLELVHERHEGWRINRQEFLTDAFYVILSATVISWLVTRLADDPLGAVKASLGLSTTWIARLPWLVQVVAAFAIYEFGQYWMHRLMHNVTPFWLTHAPHHHITQFNAAKGAVGNPIELFLVSISVLALFDFDKTALFAAANLGNVVTTFNHSNVKANPPIWYGYFLTTVRHHSLHHSTDYESTRCNYGNALILLDRIFGTYREGEGVLVGQGDRTRLTIREQMLFPFVPLIDAFKSRQAKPGTESAAA